MPFPDQTPRELSRDNVERLSPGQKGVYGLLTADGEYTFVGSGDIREQLLAHLGLDDPCRPTHWVDWRLPPAYYTAIIEKPDLSLRERELIDELAPSCTHQPS